MKRQSETRLLECRRLEKLADQTLVNIRKLRTSAERLLRCLRGPGNLTGRDRPDRPDDESGWRLAA